MRSSSKELLIQLLSSPVTPRIPINPGNWFVPGQGYKTTAGGWDGGSTCKRRRRVKDGWREEERERGEHGKREEEGWGEWDVSLCLLTGSDLLQGFTDWRCSVLCDHRGKIRAVQCCWTETSWVTVLECNTSCRTSMGFKKKKVRVINVFKMSSVQFLKH